jgi:hypothetical protein
MGEWLRHRLARGDAGAPAGARPADLRGPPDGPGGRGAPAPPAALGPEPVARRTAPDRSRGVTALPARRSFPCCSHDAAHAVRRLDACNGGMTSGRCAPMQGRRHRRPVSGCTCTGSAGWATTRSAVRPSTPAAAAGYAPVCECSPTGHPLSTGSPDEVSTLAACSPSQSSSRPHPGATGCTSTGCTSTGSGTGSTTRSAAPSSTAAAAGASAPHSDLRGLPHCWA